MRKGEALIHLCERLRRVEEAMKEGNARKMGNELQQIFDTWLTIAEKAK